ncbi:hypothetical protein RMSM_06769 [Rhodopirellula maiorica SM1]|uniref:Uncharacterized protein n=1 Tax=Rhodopirellula maiorica SM1 TaxID=1265738 RepID=M5RAC9_9BACT|nr:hypothetical protein RMSM_06769 [Rhodopirellula maiorica SM1]
MTNERDHWGHDRPRNCGEPFEGDGAAVAAVWAAVESFAAARTSLPLPD